MGDWPLGAVDLKVLNLESERAFYAKLGLSEMPDGDAVAMGVEGRVLVRLHEMSVWGQKRPVGTAGLYHLGLRVPSQAALGSFAWRVLDESVRWLRSADHGFSQSFYFADPDGNGVEVYSDRPEEEWPQQPINLQSGRLDFEGLLAAGPRGVAGFGPEVVVGHLHLNVADLDKSTKFYVKLGMHLNGPKDARKRYLSWNDYHHHLAINLLEGRGALKVDGGESGIEGYETCMVQGKRADPDGIIVRAVL